MKETHSEIVAPAEKLPPEIIGEIFSTLISTDGAVNYAKFRDQTASPWNIASVCQQWRTVALDSPGLWSTVRIGPCFTQLKVPHSSVQSLQLSLSRSSTHPLDVYLTLDRLISPSHERFMHQLATAVALHAPRFRKLHLSELDPDDVWDVLAPLRGSMVMLEELSFAIPRSWGSIPIDLFSNTPRLTRVDIRSSDPRCIPLPWSQLTQFTWYGSSHYGGYARIDWLNDMPNLHTCTLEADRPFRTSSDRLPVVAPSVRSFTVCSSRQYADTQERILSELTLPGLERLTFSIHKHEIERFLTMHNRSAFDLTHLSLAEITTSAITEEHWSKLLSATPSLVSLGAAGSIRDGALIDPLVRVLQLSEDITTPLVPVLRSLHIVRLRTKDDFAALLRMVVTRSHSSLKEMEFFQDMSDLTPPWDSILGQCAKGFVLRLQGRRVL